VVLNKQLTNVESISKTKHSSFARGTPELPSGTNTGKVEAGRRAAAASA
jgi:hypothetical protein